MKTSDVNDVIILRPIGKVIGAEPKEIEVAPEFVDGLEGVEEKEYLWVLYWMNQLAEAERRRLQVHPKGDKTQPQRGVFALHSPMRPNPIGMTRVKLVRRCGNRLLVEGLDALEGSPVLDIKSG